MSGMVTLIHRVRAISALRALWRGLTAPLSAFRDIRIIVERNGHLHHFYVTAAVQRAVQRVGIGTVALACGLIGWSGVMRFQANRVLRDNEVLYAELLGAAQAEGSMTTEELRTLSTGDLAALVRERASVLRGQVNVAVDLLAASNGNVAESIERVGVPVSSTPESSTEGSGGEDVAGMLALGNTGRISDALARTRRIATTVRALPDRLPLDNHRTTSDFGLRRHPITFTRTLHPGLDLVSDADQTVHAVRAGRVLFAGRSGGYGKTVVIAHESGVETRYAHLRQFSVARGDSVREWQSIGEVGSSGLSTGPHLHYEIRLLGRALDPQRILELHAHVR